MKTKEQVELEMYNVGGSLVELKRIKINMRLFKTLNTTVESQDSLIFLRSKHSIRRKGGAGNSCELCEEVTPWEQC